MIESTNVRVRGWRRASRLAMAVAAAVLLILPSAAAASRPTTVVDTTYGVRPPRITTADGTLDFFMFFSDVTGPVAELFYWEPGETPGADSALLGFEGATSVDGDVVTGELSVIDPETNEFVGVAVYELTFTPTGAPTTEEIERRDGNVRFLQTIVRQEMAVSGTLTMPTGAVMPIEHEGGKDVYATWSTAPAARIDEGTQTIAGAEWTIDGQPLVFRTVRTALASEAVVILSEATGEVAGHANPTWTGDQMVAEMDLLRNREVVGSARIEVSVAPLNSSWHFELYPGKRLKVTVEALAVSGMATITIDGVTRTLVIDGTTGFGERETWHGADRPMKDDGGGEG